MTTFTASEYKVSYDYIFKTSLYYCFNFSINRDAPVKVNSNEPPLPIGTLVACDEEAKQVRNNHCHRIHFHSDFYWFHKIAQSCLELKEGLGISLRDKVRNGAIRSRTIKKPYA